MIKIQRVEIRIIEIITKLIQIIKITKKVEIIKKSRALYKMKKIEEKDIQIFHKKKTMSKING